LGAEHRHRQARQAVRTRTTSRSASRTKPGRPSRTRIRRAATARICTFWTASPSWTESRRTAPLLLPGHRSPRERTGASPNTSRNHVLDFSLNPQSGCGARNGTVGTQQPDFTKRHVAQTNDSHGGCACSTQTTANQDCPAQSSWPACLFSSGSVDRLPKKTRHFFFFLSFFLDPYLPCTQTRCISLLLI